MSEIRLNQSQYAKLKGLTRQAVSLQVKAGKLAVGPDGKILVTREEEPAAVEPPVAVALPGGSVVALPSIHESRRAREAYEAKRRELEYLQSAGDLVAVAEVSAAWGRMRDDCRDALLSIPDELGDRLASESDPVKCREMMRRKIYEALRHLEERGKKAAAA